MSSDVTEKCAIYFRYVNVLGYASEVAEYLRTPYPLLM